MAKAQYKPTAMLDPLAELREATTTATANPVPTTQPTTVAVKSEEVPPATGARMPEAEPAVTLPIPPATTQSPTTLSIAPAKPLSANAKTSRNTIYLYPEDTTKLRHLSAYAAGTHGIRANDSNIIRAALSLVEQDVRFVHALRLAIQADRRRARI